MAWQASSEGAGRAPQRQLQQPAARPRGNSLSGYLGNQSGLCYNGLGELGSSSGSSASRDEAQELVLGRLMSMEVFRKLHPTVIRNLCSHAFLERIDKNVLVFRQGDDAINWYALLEGSVDVKVCHQAKGGRLKDDQEYQEATLCTLGAGTTFGASVTPGRAHGVSVVTSEECTLLRVRRADFQEIFADQAHLLGSGEPAALATALAALKRPQQHSQPESRASSRSTQESSQQKEHANEHDKHWRQADSYHRRDSGAGYGEHATGSRLDAPQQQQQLRHQQRGSIEDVENECEEDDEEDGDEEELAAKVGRIARVLRTLLLSSQPQLLQNRRLQPHHLLHHGSHHHHQSRHKQRSRAALQAGLSQHQTQAPQTGAHQQLSAAQPAASSRASAGRKVASYVASSLASMGRSSISSSSSSTQRQSSAVTLSYSANTGPVSSSSTSFQPSRSPETAGPSSSRHLVGPSNSFDAPLSRFSGTGGEQLSASVPVLFRRCMVGREMVDWLLELTCEPASSASESGSSRLGSKSSTGSSRLQALSMWQVLLERGLVVALTAESEAAAESSNSNNNNNSERGGASGVAAPSGSGSAKSKWAQPCCQFLFQDHPSAYYRFWLDQPTSASRGGGGFSAGDQQQQPLASQTYDKPLPRPSSGEAQLARGSLRWALRGLAKLAPDACLRLILAKEAHERSAEEVDIVFEELQHLKALSHLTVSVKRELAGCVSGEHHPKQNTVIFNQGDTGHCWYIILRGSVLVIIVGKGVVCSLHEGDDFGKLALVNDAPRAATIVTNASNCYFLRVDKHDFNTILRDVEANTVRLKEHGKEVLILQRVPTAATEQSGAPPNQASQEQGAQDAAGGAQEASQPPAAQATQPAPSSQQQQQALSNALKYMVMAGTGEKMLEHLLETRIDGHTQSAAPLTGSANLLLQHDQVSAHIPTGHGDNFLEDFILTHTIFMPTGSLCLELLKHYQCQMRRLPSANGASSAAAAAAASSPTPEAGGGAASNGSETQLDDEYLVAKKRRVVKFVRCWMLIAREHFFHQHQIQSFLTTMHRNLKQDATRHSSLEAELKLVARMLELHLEEELAARHRGCQRWIEDQYGSILPIRRHCGPWEPSGGELFLSQLQMRRFELKPSSIQTQDELVIRVYCADHSFTSLRARIDERVAEIKQLAARRLKLSDKELILVHVKSNGERIIYNDLDFITATLTVNGRIFVCPLDHIDAISPLASQDPFQAAALPGPNEPTTTSTVTTTTTATTSTNSNNHTTSGATNQQAPTGSLSSHLLDLTPTNTADIRAQMSLSAAKLEEFSSRDIAYCLSQLAWALLRNMHEVELIFLVFGRHQFKLPTANLNVFLRHFNEIQFWVITQICLSSSLSKRVQMLRKFIKIAAHCKELQNLNAFFAIIMGLSNMAVARLTQTWERLPNKLKRTYSQFESLIDPSRNHHRYRIFISKMEPPIIPFMPLFLKDVTFAHEGNKTHLENGLINFEKMQMVAQSLRTIRYCKSRPMKLDSSACKYKGSIRAIELFLRDLKIIDNQRTLTQMSQRLEHRKK